jgi:hypothetical protein
MEWFGGKTSTTMRTRLPTSTKLSPAKLALGYISPIEKSGKLLGQEDE